LFGGTSKNHLRHVKIKVISSGQVKKIDYFICTLNFRRGFRRFFQLDAGLLS